MQLNILGKQYTIKSVDDERLAQKAADLLDEKIKDLQKKMGPMPTEKIAVLAGLNLAGELLAVQKEYKHKAKTLKQKLENVYSRIDQLK